MSILIFIFILALLIIVHEYGHFIVAKKSGIRVDEFGLGYPPRAATLFRRKGTVFTLNWIPFGGFVKIFGENQEELAHGEASRDSLVAKSRWTQAAVLFAGPFFNFLFAWLIVFITLLLGLPSAVSEKNTAHMSDIQTLIVEVLPDSPAERAGVEVGDSITEVSFDTEEYYPIDSLNLEEVLQEKKPESVVLVVQHGGEEIRRGISLEEGESLLGIGFQHVGIYQPPFVNAFGESFSVTGHMIADIVTGLFGLIADAFRGQADISNLTGPVGIVSLVGDASVLGFVYLLTFTALISINLGVINLIPFPALDGGRMLFLVIEKIRGRAVSPRLYAMVNTIGFGTLILLMLIVTFHDIQKLF